MTRFFSLRARLVGTVLLAIAPACAVVYWLSTRPGADSPWIGFGIGLLALGAAWIGGQRFILRHLRLLYDAARRLAAGDLGARTGSTLRHGPLGELARTFDSMAEGLQQRAAEREQSEKALLNRAFQQTVLSALGQFAWVSNDFSALLNQAVILAAQTLEVEYCQVLELLPDGQSMLLRAGVGWKEGAVGKVTVPTDPATQPGATLTAGEPVVVENQPTETRFHPCPFLLEHGVVSGVTVAISGHGRAFGILGAHTTHRRQFDEDEVHFLFAIATVLALALERDRTEAQLRQAQKMESIGQLAAGIAHDFNNMLTVIQGHSGLLLAKPGLGQQLTSPAQAIFFAAERAASLTRQLLMFSRKNVLQPQALDLREIVTNMAKMLQRLLGETITLGFQPPPTIPVVQGDPGMVEQILMNLAVNARDAMPKGGTLAISIQPVELSQSNLYFHPQGRLGSFVCLRVSDTGSGMDAATMARIFEPFFTTKEPGKGTGLGLATVYGIVKQHEGWIEVTSQPGHGSAFSVFFPATPGQVAEQAAKPAPEAAVPGGKETILVVEDELVLRDLARAILEDRGYRVFEAASGREALEVWQRERAAIDLMLTDMVLPEGLSGVELAQKLRDTKPQLKLIFASGYNVDELDTDFIRQGQALFLQKPYTHVTLARTVRDCLDKAV